MLWGRLDGNCLNFEYGANGSHGNDFLIGGGQPLESGPSMGIVLVQYPLLT